MTLKEIAEAENVSITTVSKIINNVTPSPASPEVVDRIWNAVEQSGYKPNQYSRLDTSTSPIETASKAIACLFTSITEEATDWYLSELVQGIEDESAAANYTIKHSFSFKEIDDSLIEKLRVDSVSGIIVMRQFEDTSILDFLKKHFKHVVYVGTNALPIPYDQVVCDGYKAARLIMEHLINLGHTKIGYIGACKSHQSYQGYHDSLIANGIMINEIYAMHESDYSSRHGYESALQLISTTDVTAIFAINDITAVGVLKAVNDSGLRCPEDISVVSIDNIELSQYTSPSLTTVDIPIKEMGGLACQVLIDRIEGRRKLSPVTSVFPFELVVRNSCKKL